MGAGDELVVPVATSRRCRIRCTTSRALGDTLVTVADRFNVSVEDLRRWNHLSSSRMKPQRSLYVAEPVHLAPAAHVRSKSVAHDRGRQGDRARRKRAEAHPSKTPHAKQSAKHATKKKTTRAKHVRALPSETATLPH